MQFWKKQLKLLKNLLNVFFLSITSFNLLYIWEIPLSGNSASVKELKLISA